MYKNIADYLDRLKIAMRGCDQALIQDALADAEEHLRTSLENEIEDNPELSESELLHQVINKYGAPAETAAAYQKIEAILSPAIAHISPPKKRSGISGFFAILSEPRAWSAALFMLLSVVTGTVFGGWAILAGIFAGVSLIFVIGLPLAGLYLLSLRGVALMEGRIIEALLGIRMPHKPIFLESGQSLTDKFKALITDRYTWRIVLYFFLLFPLSLFYTLSIFILFVLSLCFLLAPLLELVFFLPLELFGTNTFTPVWLLPFVSLAGSIMLPLTLHYAGFIGRMHGRFAKAMLVRKQ